MPETGMSSWQTKRAGQALEKLNEALALGLNVCAYGGIDVEIGDGFYLRLARADSGYVLAEQYQ